MIGLCISVTFYKEDKGLGIYVIQVFAPLFYCFFFGTEWLSIGFFKITAEIHARSLANFYCQYADRHMNLRFVRRVS